MIPAITTNSIKAHHPVFTLQSKAPQEVILMVGSCRTVPYLNYLDRYNRTNGFPLRVHFIEPWNQHWDAMDRPQDFEAALLRCESDDRILSVLKEATILIHEHYGNAGMFNTLPSAEKNIFQFGLAPKMNITIPNLHDIFCLGTEQLQFDTEKQAHFRAHGMDKELFEKMQAFGLAQIQRFYDVCELSSFPEFADHFRAHWQEKRYFWRGNHVSKHFTMELFNLMNLRFLNLRLDEAFWRGANEEDLYGNHIVPMTDYDVKAYDLKWNEPCLPIQIP